MQGYTMYLLGYQTAYNRLAKDTFDIFDGFEVEQLFAWIENWCRENPLEKYYQGINALTDFVFERRKRSRS